MDKNNSFNIKQFGFREKLDTNDALLQFMSQEYTCINERKYFSGIFVDIMKAFDRVDHDILLTRMYEDGMRGVALHWFYSYLNNRTQQTKVNNTYSEPGLYGKSPMVLSLWSLVFNICKYPMQWKFHGRPCSFC